MDFIVGLPRTKKGFDLVHSRLLNQVYTLPTNVNQVSCERFGLGIYQGDSAVAWSPYLYSLLS